MTTEQRAALIISALSHLDKDDARAFVEANLEEVRLLSEQAGLEQGIQALRELNSPVMQAAE